MVGFEIIVIGASAGGVKTLVELVRHLPKDLPATIFIVLHIRAQSQNLLPGILSNSGPLKAIAATHGRYFEQRSIYVAPPDYHLLIKQAYMEVISGPKENRHRPAIDPLFRSAATEYGPKVIGIVLTGMLNDGTEGLKTVKCYGGLAVVQDPKEASYANMPMSALNNVKIDYCLPVLEIATLLGRLTQTPASIAPVPPDSKGFTNEHEHSLERTAPYIERIRPLYGQYIKALRPALKTSRQTERQTK